MDSAQSKKLQAEFDSAVRGYHVYRRIWKPFLLQELKCVYEYNNPFDVFAIKTCVQGEEDKTIGHLPREISRATYFLLLRGAEVTARIATEKYRRSPLVQGGLEIGCKLIVVMPPTHLNEKLLDRFKNILEQSYLQPSEDNDIGTYINDDIDFRFSSQKAQNSNPKKKSLKKTQSQDIRLFFQNKPSKKKNSST